MTFLTQHLGLGSKQPSMV